MEAVEHLSQIQPLTIDLPTPTCPIHKRYRFDVLALLVSILMHLLVFAVAIGMVLPGGGGGGGGDGRLAEGPIRWDGSGLGDGGNFVSNSSASAKALSVSWISEVDLFSFEGNTPDQSNESLANNEYREKDLPIYPVENSSSKIGDIRPLSYRTDLQMGEISVRKVSVKEAIESNRLESAPVKSKPSRKEDYAGQELAISNKSPKASIEKQEKVTQPQNVSSGATYETSDSPKASAGIGDGREASSDGEGAGLGDGVGVGEGRGINGGQTGYGVSYRPILVKSPKPDYPSGAREMGFEGAVALAVMVDPSGEVKDVNVIKSSGRADCDAEAAQTVKNRWRFKPAEKNGAPVEAMERVEVEFKLYS